MKKKIATAIISIALVTGIHGLVGCSSTRLKLAAPSNLSKYTVKDYGIHEGDIYVSTNGNDQNEGTKDSPYATIEKAQEECRVRVKNNDYTNGKITVSIMAGRYYTDSLTFNELDSGSGMGSENYEVEYCAYGDGEVVISGGINLDTADFRELSTADKARLSDSAKNNVKVLDLTTYGLIAEDLGKLYAVGGFHNATKYDGDTVGSNQCELFYDGKRMNIARYPNEGYINVNKVIDSGQTREHGENLTNWETVRNPRGGTFRVDNETRKHMATWQEVTEAWVFGYFYWDWADASTPITNIDKERGSVTTQYASTYGWKNDAKYYFYNVFEELDTDGEWYLDRDTGKLYVYVSTGFDSSTLSLSLATKSILNLENASNMTFRGLTITDSRADAITVKGNNNQFLNCVIKNSAGDGITVNGSDNLIKECDIFRMGEGGIILDGGDREKLISANNIADNNYIHHYGEIFKTYRAGISLHGVGNIICNNEIAFAPHMAVFYGGNNHLIEYNDIHDVVQYSSDAGAIYAGRHVTYYGNVIRYNAIYDIGSDEFAPSGIYFDDMLAGQTAYGNLLINIPSNAFLVGGGKDINLSNNLIINAGNGVSYDDRGYAGLHHDGWYKPNVENPNSRHYQLLEQIPHGNAIWEAAYPNMFKMHSDFDNQEDIDFAVNPSYSNIFANLVFGRKASFGIIEKSVRKYSTIDNNGWYKLVYYKSSFVDYDNEDYTLVSGSKPLSEVPEFRTIPFEKIGRY